MKIGPAIKNVVYGTILVSTVSDLIPKDNIRIEDRIVADTFQKKEAKNVLVIDSYNQNIVPIDMGFMPDVTHGYVTSKVIERGLPNANVYKGNIPGSLMEYNEKTGERREILNNILTDIKSGKKYDAANISLGIEVSFDDLNKKTGLDITAKNVKEKSRELKDYLIENPDIIVDTFGDIKAGSVMDFVDGMDSISARGTKVYVSAGNEGKNHFNLYSLIDNSTTVGALSPNGEKASYSCDNSIVSDWENGTLEVTKTEDGFNFTGGNETDVESKYTSNIFKIPGFDIKGTSFAAPHALVNDLKN